LRGEIKKGKLKIGERRQKKREEGVDSIAVNGNRGPRVSGKKDRTIVLRGKKRDHRIRRKGREEQGKKEKNKREITQEEEFQAREASERSKDTKVTRFCFGGGIKKKTALGLIEGRRTMKTGGGPGVTFGDTDNA